MIDFLDSIYSVLQVSAKKTLFGGERKKEGSLAKCARDASKIALDSIHGLSVQMAKEELFGPQ